MKAGQRVDLLVKMSSNVKLVHAVDQHCRAVRLVLTRAEHPRIVMSEFNATNTSKSLLVIYSR